MARIPDEQVTRIKQEVSLLRRVESQGHTVTRQGKDSVVRCPFHEEQTPSCIISPKTNLYHCFGCGAAGSVIDWVMRTENLAFREAIESLSPHLSLAVSSLSPAQEVASLPDEEKQALLTRVIDFYHSTLKQSAEALGYLKARGLNAPELIDTFRLGYANRTLGLTLPEKNRKAGAAIRQQLQGIGLLRESGHEHFNGSLVIPVTEEQGRITEVYGRKLLNNLRKGTAKHLYLPGPHAGIFNPFALGGPEIILCESLIDALTFWRHGLRHVTASYGVQGFTPEMAEAFKQSPIKKIYLAYDNDEAGNHASEVLSERLVPEGFTVYRVVFPAGLDANSFALQQGAADVALKKVLDNAVYIGGKTMSESTHKKPVPSRESRNENGKGNAKENGKDNWKSKDTAPELELINGEAHVDYGNRHYRVRGLDKAKHYQQLKTTLSVTCEGALYIDQLDVYHAKARQNFIQHAALELGIAEEVVKQDMNGLLLQLEDVQTAQIKQAVAVEDSLKDVPETDKASALELLRDPNLLGRILEDLDACGVVGEESNKLVGYLAAVSRKLDKPLAVIVQSTSAAGKSSLMNAILAMVPEEEKVQYSAMTGQSLFYMGETNLKHKILAIAEEEGAEQASYALKLLQSEGELTIASTGKDAEGNLTTQEYRVEGPVMLFSTTTAIDIDEELMNRCVVLTVNESEAQTQLIHNVQRGTTTLEGLIADEERERLLRVHRYAQHLLQPVEVVNSYAHQLTFMTHRTRFRRDHTKYLRLISSIALLHQYQREPKALNYGGSVIEYIEVSLDDIAVANALTHDILGRSLDELPPQTRKLLDNIQAMVQIACAEKRQTQERYRFTRRDIREVTGWSDGQLKIHCHRLEEMEYLLVHGGGRGRLMEYELIYDGPPDQQGQYMMGLVDMKTLGYDPGKSGLNWEKLGLNAQTAGSGQAQVRGKSGPGQGQKSAKNTVKTGLNGKTPKMNGNSVVREEKKSSSYTNRTTDKENV